MYRVIVRNAAKSERVVYTTFDRTEAKDIADKMLGRAIDIGTIVESFAVNTHDQRLDTMERRQHRRLP